MKTITVLIPDAEHPLALPVMRSLGLTGRVRVDLMTSNPRSYYRLSRYCRRSHVTASPIISEERREAILKAIASAHIDVLLPVSVVGAYLVAAERPSLAGHVAIPPLPDTATLKTANDKAALCLLAQRHGVPTPPSLVYPDEVPDHGALERLPYPVLLKARTLEGGQGIQLFHDPPALAAFLTSSEVPPGARYLLQSYLAGADYGLNVLCRDGEILAYTVQRNAISAPPPFGPAAGIHFLQDADVLETGRRLLSALHWNGVANLDMLRCAASGETLLLEMNPRYWGTLMGSVYAGVNFPYLACLAALGLPVPPTEHQPITYARKFVALRQIPRMLTGRPHLAQLQLRNTAVAASLKDPLPALAHYWKSLLKSTTGRAARVFRRSRKKERSP